MRSRYTSFDEYGFRHLVLHLARSGRWGAAVGCLTDFDFMETKCERLSVYDLEEDYRIALTSIPENDSRRAILEVFSNAMALETRALVHSPQYLFPQLYSRLRWTDSPDRTLDLALAGGVTWYDDRPWLELIESLPLTAMKRGLVRDHAGGVLACAISPDETQIVTASQDCTLKIWDLDTGVLVNTLRGHTAQVNACAISPDGRLVVSGSDDKTVRVWSLNTGEQEQIMEGHTGKVKACVVTRDSKGYFGVQRWDDQSVGHGDWPAS